MSRIRRGYEDRFRALLRRARARRLEQGVQWLVAKARRLSAREGISLADALAQVYERLATRKPFQQSASQPAPSPVPVRCRVWAGWPGGCGRPATRRPGSRTSRTTNCCARRGALPATVLTTDGMLMERRLLRDRIIPAFWLPPTLSIPEQLALVFREFGLTLRGPRCMSCGGELRRGSKEALRERIPPRTYRWLDEFFVCGRCDKLFWHGTHWHRIVGTLAALKSRRSGRGTAGV